MVLIFEKITISLEPFRLRLFASQMTTAQIIIFWGMRSLSSCHKHIFAGADFEKRFVEIRHADRLGINLHFANSHPLHHRQKTLIQSHIHREREWQKNSPPTPKNPFRLPQRKIHLRAAAAPYCHGKKRARAYRVSKKCQLWVAEFTGKRGARKRDTRRESEIGGEFEPDECSPRPGSIGVLCGGRASIFCECTSSIGAVNEIDGRREKWLARSLSRTHAPSVHPRTHTDRHTRQQTHICIESLWRAVELQSHPHSLARWQLGAFDCGTQARALKINCCCMRGVCVRFANKNH